MGGRGGRGGYGIEQYDDGDADAGRDDAFDLVLSTYSLSEMDLAMQRHYGERLLNRAPNLYVATNAPPGGNMFGEFAGRRGTGGWTTLPRGPFLRRLLDYALPTTDDLRLTPYSFLPTTYYLLTTY